MLVPTTLVSSGTISMPNYLCKDPIDNEKWWEPNADPGGGEVELSAMTIITGILSEVKKSMYRYKMFSWFIESALHTVTHTVH